PPFGRNFRRPGSKSKHWTWSGMYFTPQISEGLGFLAIASGYDLGEDGNGDFLWGLRTYVDACGTVDGLQKIFRNVPLAFQKFPKELFTPFSGPQKPKISRAFPPKGHKEL